MTYTRVVCLSRSRSPRLYFRARLATSRAISAHSGLIRKWRRSLCWGTRRDGGPFTSRQRGLLRVGAFPGTVRGPCANGARRCNVSSLLRPPYVSKVGAFAMQRLVYRFFLLLSKSYRGELVYYPQHCVSENEGIRRSSKDSKHFNRKES